eukprot:201797_1
MLSYAPHSMDPDSNLQSVLKQLGFRRIQKIIATLQGTIWRAHHQSSNQSIVIKVANKLLNSQSLTNINGTLQHIQENILSETKILQYLTSILLQTQSKTDLLTKHLGFYSTHSDYLLFMQDGGTCCFDFCVAAHHLIQSGKLDIAEWHAMVKVIFKRMIECIAFIHSNNVCHFDISLENFLIMCDVVSTENGQLIKFSKQNVKVSLCDFGVAEFFGKGSDFRSTKFCGKDNYKSNEVVQKKAFNAKLNDCWGLGIVLFSLVIGCGPFTSACRSDERFCRIMDGDLVNLLTEWNKMEYVNDDLLELFGLIFQNEDQRCDLGGMSKCKWMQT